MGGHSTSGDGDDGPAPAPAPGLALEPVEPPSSEDEVEEESCAGRARGGVALAAPAVPGVPGAARSTHTQPRPPSLERGRSLITAGSLFGAVFERPPTVFE